MDFIKLDLQHIAQTATTLKARWKIQYVKGKSWCQIKVKNKGTECKLKKEMVYKAEFRAKNLWIS
jgi:hypothetical protein